MFSCVLIVTAADRDAANERAERGGHGPNNYSIPLSPDGTDPATHYGLHVWAQNEPEPIEGRICSVGVEAAGHFAEVCEAHGLMAITSDPDA